MKYIMLKKDKEGVQHYVPVIFPTTLVHEDIANAMLDVLPDYEVHSAGEISPFTLGDVHGSSETLNVKSDPADSQRIKMNDYFYGCE